MRRRGLSSAQKIRFLANPPEYYATILDKIGQARTNITLSALYLGVGRPEQRILAAIECALQRNSNLTVTFVLDHARARRGRHATSVSAVAPLLQAPRVTLLLYRMPHASGPFARLCASPVAARWAPALAHLHGQVRFPLPQRN